MESIEEECWKSSEAADIIKTVLARRCRWVLVANLPAELKTRRGTLWPGATWNPVGRFGPEKRGQNGVAPGHGVDFPASELFLVSAWEFSRCNGLQRCRPRP
jgi:hypothetical protein